MPDEPITTPDASTAAPEAPPQDSAPAPATPAAPAEDWQKKYRDLDDNYRSTMYGIGENIKRVAEVDPRLKFLVEKHPNDWDTEIEKLRGPAPEPAKPPQTVTPEVQKWIEDREKQITAKYDERLADIDAWRNASFNNQVAEARSYGIVREMEKYEEFKSDHAFEMVRPIIAQRVNELQPQTQEQMQAIVKEVHGQFKSWQDGVLQFYTTKKQTQRAGTPPAITAGSGQPAPNQPAPKKTSAEDGSATRELQNQIDAALSAQK